MADIVIAAAVAELAIAALVLVRLARGPSVCDRVLALNTMSTQATLALLLFAVWADRTIYLDVALWLASLSFLGTFVYARLLERELL